MDDQPHEFRAVPNEDLAFLGTDPIPAKPYYCPDYFERERHAIFRRTWLHVGRLSEVAQPYRYVVRTLEVANAQVLIVHGADGVIRAFHNVCTHRGSQLVADEAGSSRLFACRYHRWTFGPDGSLRGVPDMERFTGLDMAACGLRPVALETVAGFMFINLAPQPAQGLRQFLGPIADMMESRGMGEYDRHSEYRYEVRANWKLAYDNFQEVYHLRWVHEHSAARRSTSPSNPFGYGTDYHFHGQHRGMRLEFYLESASKTPVEAVMSRALQAPANVPAMTPAASNEFLCLFPNLFLFMPVGGGGFTQQFWPLAHDRTRSVVHTFGRGADQNASMRIAREYALSSTIDVHSEDRDVILGSQIGLETGAIDHMHFQSQEILLRHAFHMVDEAVRSWSDEQGLNR